jgi:hypothetical protein
MNRRGIPPEANASLKKGEKRAIPLDGTMNVVQLHDKWVVSVLSTLHSDKTVTVTRRSRHAPGGHEDVEKPEAITEYNKYMGSIDRGDQLLSYYGFPHCTVKWWRRAFFFLVDAAIVNSYIMYSRQTTGRHMSHELFRIELAKELIKASNSFSITRRATTRSSPPTTTATRSPHRTPLPWTVFDIINWQADSALLWCLQQQKGERKEDYHLLLQAV